LQNPLSQRRPAARRRPLRHRFASQMPARRPGAAAALR
jgi:hypothetical protein